jgi:GR25 family glycosyltransferase involved in LPS biosynthesis
MYLKYLLFIIISIVILYLLYPNNIEYFKSDGIEYYIISMKKANRLENIQKQLNKINNNRNDKINFNTVDAVVGTELDLNDLIKKNILSSDYNGNGIFNSKQRKGEIGCYLSHVKIYNIIKNNNKVGYSVILEDDFDIKSDNFLEKMEKIINLVKDIDFDLLYLGTNYNNHGEHIIEDIYHVDKKGNLFGAHAILINNKNIDKLIELTKLVDYPIDVKLEQLCFSDKLNSIVLYPHIISQQFNKLDSAITVEGFNLKFKSN